MCRDEPEDIHHLTAELLCRAAVNKVERLAATDACFRADRKQSLQQEQFTTKINDL